jgi:hypothetical protein
MEQKQTFVSTLLQLPVVGGLLNKIQDLLGQALVRDGPCSTGVVGHFVRLRLVYERGRVGDVEGTENLWQAGSLQRLLTLVLCRTMFCDEKKVILPADEKSCRDAGSKFLPRH